LSIQDSDSDSGSDLDLVSPFVVPQGKGKSSLRHSKSQDSGKVGTYSLGVAVGSLSSQYDCKRCKHYTKIVDDCSTQQVAELQAMLYRQQQESKEREAKLVQAVDTLKKNQAAISKHLAHGANSTQEFNDLKVGESVKNISKHKKSSQLGAAKIAKPRVCLLFGFISRLICRF
jgi:hypothetical protein